MKRLLSSLLPLALATSMQPAPAEAQLEPCSPAYSLRCKLEALERLSPPVPVERSPALQSSEAQPLNGTATPPRRFDQSLDALVREGLVSPMERARMQGGGGAHQQACRTGALSSQECREGIPIRWGRWSGGTQPKPATARPTQAPPSPSARPAGVVLISGCIHTPFSADASGRLVSTYSCANSDVAGYSIAVDCPRQLTSIYGPKTGINDPYTWGAWVEPGDSHQRAAMEVACAPLFKAAGQGVR
jgi:hypothetical protein